MAVIIKRTFIASVISRFHTGNLNICSTRYKYNYEFFNTFGTVTPAKSFTSPERGIRTPQSTYYRTLLEALIELGGKAEPKEVLPRVYAKVKHLLTDYDHEQLPSDPRKIRWRTATRFASHELRVQGLLTNSPHGIWEISAAGRRFIEETRSAAE